MFEETPGGTTTAHILTNFKSKLKRLLLLSLNCLWIHLFMNFSSHCEVFECSLDKQHRVSWVLSVNTEIERELSKDIEALGTAYTNFCNALEKTENTGVLWKSIPKPTVSVITASTEEGESTTIHHMNKTSWPQDAKPPWAVGIWKNCACAAKQYLQFIAVFWVV